MESLESRSLKGYCTRLRPRTSHRMYSYREPGV